MVNQSECIHHWIIDTSSSNQSEGRCKKCNLIKTFLNSIPEKDIKWAINIIKPDYPKPEVVR